MAGIMNNLEGFQSLNSLEDHFWILRVSLFPITEHNPKSKLKEFSVLKKALRSWEWTEFSPAFD